MKQNNKDRRLIEEFIPIKEISEASAIEKNRRNGNLSTVHVWWARRPLAACRAAVFASLVKLDKPEKINEYNKLYGRINHELIGCKLKPIDWLRLQDIRTPQDLINIQDERIEINE